MNGDSDPTEQYRATSFSNVLISAESNNNEAAADVSGYENFGQTEMSER